MEHVVITLLSIFLLPGAISLTLVILLASLGKSLGVRKLYVNILLKVFEFGRLKIAQRDGEITTKKENESVQLIDREVVMSASAGMQVTKTQSLESMKGEFQLMDMMDFCKSGVESIIEDEVTRCFTSDELSSWNLLSRTNQNYHYISLRLTVLWGIGLFVRYCILLPFRLCLATIGIGWLLVSTAFIGYLPQGRFKIWLNAQASLMCYRVLARAFSALIIFHNRENRALEGGICVANHTSPIDVMILAVDNCYAMVGQSHGGFLGLLQRAMSRATRHIWFERAEVKDRSLVARRLREHVENPNNLPVLIFPEGTCINNTSVMMFKKGSFEIGCKVYPVAIKYDLRFADTFWNSSKQSMVSHILMMMTSWAIVCDVWYLPPETMREDEDAIKFANRIKRQIATKGGLVDLEWDGGLKRAKPKETIKQKQQESYSKLLKIE